MTKNWNNYYKNGQSLNDKNILEQLENTQNIVILDNKMISW